MAIRMTGLISGLDTDAVVAQLISAQGLKKTKIEQKKTKLEWKQEKWAELNTKIYKLYTDQLSKLRFSSSYKSKATTSSDETKVTATAGSGAGIGSHTISVSTLASAQYVTGAQVSYTKNTRLTDCGFTEGQIITVTAGENTKTLQVGAGTTISDFVSTMQNAGLNASYDEAQGRFFISSSSSGSKNAFSITTTNISSTPEGANLLNSRTAIADLVGSSAANTFFDSYEQAVAARDEKLAAYEAAKESGSGILAAWEEWQDAEEAVTKLTDDLVATIESNAEKTANENAKKTVIEEKKNEILGATEDDADNYKLLTDITDAAKKAYYEVDEDGNVKDSLTFTESTLDKAKEAIKSEATKAVNDAIAAGEVSYATAAEKQAAVDAKYAELVAGDEEAALQAKATELYNKAIENGAESAAASYAATDEGKAEIAAIVESDDSISNAAANAEAAIQNYTDALTAYNEALQNGTTATATDAAGLAGLGLGEITATGLTGNAGATFVKAENAVITLDNAILTSESNSITVADVTYELKGVTTGNVVVGVSSDTQATYDMIKDFVKTYNELMTEMNELYYADSAKGYEPLSDEEKEAMSESQIELWEDKIKGALLRRDDTLGSVLNTMRSSLATSVNVGGKAYSLSSFGICTGEYTEKGLLHIYGDEDDALYMDQTNRLKDMLNSDPDVVMEAISGLAKNLYSSLQDKMKSSTLSSALTFYNDKEMKNQISDYEDEIEKWEDKLLDLEDRYYNQFAAMESALASLTQQQSYLSSLMG